MAAFIMRSTLPTKSEVKHLLRRSIRKHRRVPEYSALTAELNGEILACLERIRRARSEEYRTAYLDHLQDLNQEKHRAEEAEIETIRTVLETIILERSWDTRMEYKTLAHQPEHSSNRRITTFKSRSPEVLLFDRYVSSVLARAFHIKTSGRDTCVRLAQDYLSSYKQETPQFSIIRVDIEAFFDSISHERLISTVKANGRVPSYVGRYVESLCGSYNKAHCTSGAGVGQGIPSSAKLAEIALEDLDRVLANDPNVGVYLRYVDDILVVCLPGYEEKLLDAMRESIAPWGLHFKERNPGDLILLSTLAAPPVLGQPVPYLGYKFIFGENLKYSGTDISDAKRERYLKAIGRIFDRVDSSRRQTYTDFLEQIQFLLCVYANHPSDGELRTVAGAPYSCRLADKTTTNLDRVLDKARYTCYQAAALGTNAGVESAKVDAIREFAARIRPTGKWLASKPQPFQDSETRTNLRELVWQ